MRSGKIYFIALIWLCGLSILSAQSDTLQFSFTNGLGKRGVTYAYPLMVSDSLTVADSLFAGEMTVTHNGTVFDIIGIQKTGTLLENVADVQFNAITKKLTFANAQPITGMGIFIDFLVTIKPGASGTTTTSLQNILLNEGNILGLITDGSMRPMDIFINPKNPPVDRIVGDTIQFSVSGDVHLPLTWTVGDTHIVSIDGTGRVIGKNVGQTSVTVTDDLGLSDQSNLLPILPATLRSLTVTVPDVSVMQNLTFLLPINVSTVTGLGITSAQFRLNYNTSLLVPLGVVQNGSLSQSWSTPSISFGSGYVDVAMAGAQPLTDSGAFVFIQFKVKRYANFSSALTLSNVLFNENLNAAVKNGIFTPIQGPVISLSGKPLDMIVGETAQLGVSGGSAPHRWKILSDTSIASIDSVSGLLLAKMRGKAVYTAVDQNGFDGMDSLMITDVRFTFPDTSFIYTDSIEYPISISSTTGFSIVAAQLALQYDTAKISFISVQRTGTLTNGMLMEIKDSAGIRLVLSSAAPLSGAGQFLRFKFKSKGLASINHNQPMFFSQTLLNESGNSIRIASQRSGSLAVLNVPNYPPVFTAKLRDTTISENQLLQFQLTASDANADSLLFGMFSGSSGMSITGKGLFTWQPDYTQAGTHKVVYDVGDFRPDGVTKDSAVISVLNVNRLPQFTRIMGDTTISEGQTLNFDVNAIDPDGSPVRFDMINAKIGMTIDSVTGVFTWTPTTTQSGIHDVVIRALDGTGGITVREVIITVTDANILPVFTQAFSDTTIQEDQILSFTLKATDADGDVVHYYIQNIQPGMVIDTNTGVISWKPTFTQAGVYNIAFIANDGKGGFANSPAVITVTNVNRVPVFTNQIQDSIVLQAGNSIGMQFTGSDPDNDPLAFALKEGPAGSTITAAGIFNWSPTLNQLGTHRVVVALSDGIVEVRDSLFITVFNVNSPPNFVRSIPDTTINEGETFVFQCSASDPDQDSILWQLAGTPPFGLTISKTGEVKWTPGFDQSGTYAIVISINDKQFSKLDSAIVTVTNTNRAPKFTGMLRDTVIFVDSLFTFAYNGNDPDGDSMRFSFIKGPVGVTLSAAGRLSWRPSVVGKETVIVSLSDGGISVYDTSIITIAGFPKLQASTFEVDFGTTIFGALPERKMTIGNAGKVPLTLQRISGLPNEQHFSTNASQQIVIDPGKEITITLFFTPQQIGSQTSGIAFRTNDPKQQYFGIMLKGTAISVAAVKRKLLVDLTHSSRVALNDSLQGMTQLFGALSSSGINVAFAETTFAPSGYDAVLLVSPQKGFTDEERTSLRTFINDGGLAVMMEDPALENNNFSINQLLRDSLLGSGMMILNSAVIDSAHNYYGDPFAPMITTFADTKHPYLNSVDSLVLFGSAMVLTDSSAVPFARATSPSIVVNAEGMANAVIGLKKIGKGTLVVIGNTRIWQNTPLINDMVPVNIAAKDNFTFALNLFSVEEDYIVSMPEKTPSEVYQLISIPLELKDVDILSVLRTSLGDINPLRWRLFGKYDPLTERYREFPSAGFTSFTRGEAYWLITRGEFSLNFGSATILPAQDYYPIRIGPGYSMIGNPFPYSVSWKNSRIGDSVQTVLWRFDPSINKFAPESLSLAPFAGYFVKNNSHDSVTIYINPASIPLPKQGMQRMYAENEWRIKIGAASGKASDDENYAGVSPSAKDELDRFDVGEPPTTPTDYVRVRFTNQNWKRHQGSYATDVRPVNTEGTYWEFDVTAAKPQSNIRLTFDQLGSLPNDFGVYIVDKGTERVTRFDRSYSYEFTMGKNQTRRQFRLVAGKQEFAEKNTNGIPLIAMAHELRQNYPNPFNPSTYIYYTIGHSGNVQLEIFNVLGQKVRMLKNELQQIGSYNVEWNGKDDAGETVSSGVYFYKVTVMNNNEKIFTQTKKMVLMK